MQQQRTTKRRRHGAPPKQQHDVVTRLPTAVARYVMTFLGFRDLDRVVAVCHGWRPFVTDRTVADAALHFAIGMPLRTLDKSAWFAARRNHHNTSAVRLAEHELRPDGLPAVFEAMKRLQQAFEHHIRARLVSHGQVVLADLCAGRRNAPVLSGLRKGHLFRVLRGGAALDSPESTWFLPPP